MKYNKLKFLSRLPVSHALRKRDKELKALEFRWNQCIFVKDKMVIAVFIEN